MMHPMLTTITSLLPRVVVMCHNVLLQLLKQLEDQDLQPPRAADLQGGHLQFLYGAPVATVALLNQPNAKTPLSGDRPAFAAAGHPRRDRKTITGAPRR